MLEARAWSVKEKDYFWRTLNVNTLYLNGMAYWPGNARDNIFATAKRHGQVKEHTPNYLNLEPGLIGAATLLEKNKRFDWAFATIESHSKSEVEPIIHSSYVNKFKFVCSQALPRIH